jgi:hypothetical protein
MGMSAHRQATLFALVAKARRFFGPGAVEEVWREMEPGLRAAGGASARFEALAWLALFLPTHDICKWVELAFDSDGVSRCTYMPTVAEGATQFSHCSGLMLGPAGRQPSCPE